MNIKLHAIICTISLLISQSNIISADTYWKFAQVFCDSNGRFVVRNVDLSKQNVSVFWKITHPYKKFSKKKAAQWMTLLSCKAPDGSEFIIPYGLDRSAKITHLPRNRNDNLTIKTKSGSLRVSCVE